MNPGQATLTVQDYGANQDERATWRRERVQGLALEWGQELGFDQGLDLGLERVAEEPGTGCLASRADMAALELQEGPALELELELEPELELGQGLWE